MNGKGAYNLKRREKSGRNMAEELQTPAPRQQSEYERIRLCFSFPTPLRLCKEPGLLASYLVT